MHDLLIKNGTVVDGTGVQPQCADIAVTDGNIVEVGRDLGSAHRVIDADGLLVTPGWIDIHTHYDAQATWDEQLAPSIWHGVTSVIMGNCGVGFAPASPDKRSWLIDIMEAVEEIPAAALNEGMQWGWESFPEYLDVLRAKPRTLNVGALLGHVPLRAYVMGERAFDSATDTDIQAMARLAADAVTGGALGFSTSRTLMHVDSTGRPIPGSFATEKELVAIGSAIGATGRGVIEWVPKSLTGDDWPGLDDDMRIMKEIALRSGRPVSFLMPECAADPEKWREQLSFCLDAASEGARIQPQVYGRPVGQLFSLQGFHPFFYLPSFEPLKEMSLAQKWQAMQNPELKQRLLTETDPNEVGMSMVFKNEDLLWPLVYRMGTPPNYAPPPEESIASLAKREDRFPREVAIDCLLENDGRNFLLFVGGGYAYKNLNAIHEMVSHPHTLLGGSDGGAHVTIVCDYSMPTSTLLNFFGDSPEGSPNHLPIEFIVKKLTKDGADHFGIEGRGTLEPGMAADINLIDMDALAVENPEFVHDLPAGEARLMQKSTGYVSTFVAGQAIQENGQATGLLPGSVF